ncbi:MAG TPA: hypothetical protein VGV38_04340 [Pyrinomonadaceae bacterium]|nr:hypothetical protein [Pyrinomonadaceae bacterium]
MATNTVPAVTALEAQGAANLFLSEHLPDRFLAVRPRLDGGAGVWLVPVVLTYAVTGALDEVGEIEVSASTGSVFSHTPIEEMRERALALYAQHRESIEAPLL